MANILQHALASIPEFKQSYERFLKQLQIDQYSSGTIAGYSQKLAAISLHCQKVPEQLSEDECRDYFSMLLSRSPSAGISYFKHTVYSLCCYRKMMHLSGLDLPLPVIRKEKKLPVVLSGQEVVRLLESCGSIRSKAILSLIYSCGLRVSELINLQIHDIDSWRMSVFIRQAKGKKDRYTPLSKSTPLDLRAYFSAYNPRIYLFNDTPGKQITEREIRYLFRDGVCIAKILKPCTLHTLRHSFATHLLEMGENILRIRDLLGHTNIKTAMDYLHIAQIPEGGMAFSPLDRLISAPPISSE